MKKIIIWLLCFGITVTSLPVFANEQKENYEQRVVERYWKSYEVNDGAYYENLVQTQEYTYVRWADTLEGKNMVSRAILWATNLLLDKEMNTEAYIEYLTTILSMMDVGMEDSILEQAAYIAEKNTSDLTDETLALGIDKFLGITTYSKLRRTLKIFFDTKEIAKLFSTKITDATQLYIYSVASASYEKKRTFLEELILYAKDKRLKKAAEDVLKVIDLEFSYIMLNYSDDLLFETIGTGMDVSGISWVDDVNPAICKMVSENFTSWLKEHGKNKLAKNALSLASIVENYGAKVGLFSKTMLLTGKAAALVVGDEVEMYRELRVMDSISDALKEAMRDYSNNVARGKVEEQYENVYKYVVAGEALSYVHTRGEYCVSEIRKKQGESPAVAEKTYIELAEKLQEGYEILEKILPETEQYVVAKDFVLSNGFIKEVIQKDSVQKDFIGVYDFSDLMAIRDNPNQNYILMNDINCGEYELKSVTFTGILDGNGYKITNMTNPLFGTIYGGMVKNLGMEVDAAVDYVERKSGGVFDGVGDGYWGTLSCFAIDSVIDNCYVEGSVYITEKEGKRISACVGGLIGAEQWQGEKLTDQMINCYNAANITFDYSIGNVYIGGLVGSYGKSHIQKSERNKEVVKFENCFNTGTIKGNLSAEYDSNVCAGGICGSSHDADFVGCYNAGDVVANSYGRSRTDLMAGGLTGLANGGYEKCIFKSCWNSGKVKSQSNEEILEIKENGIYHVDNFWGEIAAGGIAGICSAMEINQCSNQGEIEGRLYSGGLTGIIYGFGKEKQHEEDNVRIKDCCNTGKIKGNYLAGGILGISERIVFLENCYTTGEVTGNAILGGQFAGYLNQGTSYENCLYMPNGRKNVSGTMEQSNEIKRISEEQRKKKETYEGFDFVNVWEYDEGNVDTPVSLRF